MTTMFNEVPRKWSLGEVSLETYPVTPGGPPTALVARRSGGFGLQACLMGDAFAYWPGSLRRLQKTASEAEAAQGLCRIMDSLIADWQRDGAPVAIPPSGERWYAGVGSRRTPPGALELIQRVAARLAARGYGLRSGGAVGADIAFELGADKKQVFPGRPSAPMGGHFRLPPAEAYLTVDVHHPNARRLSPEVRHLMARNAQQVLGPNLDDPVGFVVCWTLDGAELGHETSPNTGGTGQAIRIASAHGVPVFNLNKPAALDRIAAHLTQHP